MRRLLSSVVVLAVLSFASAPQHSSAAVSGGSGDSHSDIEVFIREGCPHCAAAKLFLQDLQRERPALQTRIRDVGKDAAALRRLKDLVGQRQDVRPGVPAFYLRGELIIGYASEDTTGQRIRSLLDRPESESPLENACPPDEITCTPGIEEIEVPLIGRLNVQKLGLPLFTFALGLIDGFNPCSVWVLVLMLSLLVNLQDRMKILLIAGTFVAVQGLAYFLFMAAWLNAFLLVGLSRTTEVMLGWIAIVAGAIHLKDAWARGRGVSLSIPEATKPGLYTRIRSILLAENLKAAILAAVVLAVMVQIVELLCTAGLPALYTRILTMRQLNPWAYYGYLGLYNLAYMLDDIIVLAIGVITPEPSPATGKRGKDAAGHERRRYAGAWSCAASQARVADWLDDQLRLAVPHQLRCLPRRKVDELVVLSQPEPFIAVGNHYMDFNQVEDDVRTHATLDGGVAASRLWLVPSSKDNTGDSL